MKDSKNYKDWVKLVKIWSSVTALGKEKQGPAVLLSLEGKSQDAALEISEEILGSDTGLEAIIALLDEIYIKDELSEKYKAIEKFEMYRRSSSLQSESFSLNLTNSTSKLRAINSYIPPISWDSVY